jgi:Ca-activated chloride channel family protein
MTDGYVGNDMEIIGEVQKHPNARVFSFGIGSSVNRFLLDNMARHGRGEVEYVALSDDGSAAARRFHERVRSPLLTDISIDWNGVPVSDVYPKVIPDLFSAKPVILNGRYGGDGRGTIRLKGKMSGRDFVREIPVDFSSTEKRDVLATLWARTRIDDLMSQDFNGAQQGTMKDDVKQNIIQLGLDYRLMTQFTSFVAVEEMIVTDGGQPRRIDVPVEVPEGVDRERAYGADGLALFNTSRTTQNLGYLMSPTVNRAVVAGKSRSRTSKGAGGGGGVGGGSGRGVGPAAPPPRPAKAVVIDAAEETDTIRTLSPEERKRADLQARLHPSLVAVVDRLKNPKATPAAGEAKFIRDGKAELQIWLTDKSPATIAKLKALGFEVILDPKTANLVIGRVSIHKLAALAELKEVRYVAPQISN